MPSALLRFIGNIKHINFMHIFRVADTPTFITHYKHYKQFILHRLQASTEKFAYKRIHHRKVGRKYNHNSYDKQTESMHKLYM